MKSRLLILSLLLGIFCFTKAQDSAPFRYVGGDISLLPDYEAAKSKYYDETGKPINDVLKFCYDEGMNCMRVRLFVDPKAYITSNPKADTNAKQDLEYIIPLCQRIQNDGMALMLDFHYSDTWADPVKQWTPIAWQGLTDAQLVQKIYDYTKESLETLKANGVVPEFIQTGNEISYGMLWGPEGTKDNKVYPDNDANWDRFFSLLESAIKACREVCPDAGIILHNERIANLNYLTGFYKRMADRKIDYDIIGLSYYPYFHGAMSQLKNALSTLSVQQKDKQIMIVETGYSYQWEVQGTNQKVDYPYSEEGQNQFAKDLVDLLLQYENCTGLFWWWMEYNAYGTKLENWYNAPLFNSLTGRATPALKTICTFGSGKYNGIEDIPYVEEDNSGLWYDLQGRPFVHPTVPGIYIHNGRKTIVK